MAQPAAMEHGPRSCGEADLEPPPVTGQVRHVLASEYSYTTCGVRLSFGLCLSKFVRVSMWSPPLLHVLEAAFYEATVA